MNFGKCVLLDNPFDHLGDKVLPPKNSLSFLQTLEGPDTCLRGFTDLDVSTKLCPGPCAHKSQILNNVLDTDWIRPGSCPCLLLSATIVWYCSPTSSTCTGQTKLNRPMPRYHYYLQLRPHVNIGLILQQSLHPVGH